MKIIRIISLLLFSVALLWVAYCAVTLPDLSGLGNKTRAPSISVLDDNRKIMGSSGDVYAGSINYKDISDNLIKAVVLIEAAEVAADSSSTQLSLSSTRPC